MDEQLVWRDEFNMGIKVIDDERQKLFQIISKVFSLTGEETKNGRACQGGLSISSLTP